MSQSVVQQSSEVTVTSGTTGNVTITGVAAGNLLVLVADNETNGQTFNAPTDTNGSWSIAVQTGNSSDGMSYIAYSQNVAAGSHTVTLTPGAGSVTYKFKVLEISGSVTSGNPDTTSSIVQGASTSHTSSVDASHINPSGPCICICVGSTNTGPGTKTPGSGYTTIANTLNFGHWQYQIFSSTPINEQGAWTSQNSCANAGVIAAFVSAGGNTYNVTASGGAVIGSSATIAATYNHTDTGGTVLGGSATISVRLNITATGGGVIGGSASVPASGNITASGGCLIGGTALLSLISSKTATGGVICGSTATLLMVFNPTQNASGSLVGGSSTISRVISPVLSGGVVIGGNAVLSNPIFVMLIGEVSISGYQADVILSSYEAEVIL